MGLHTPTRARRRARVGTTLLVLAGLVLLGACSAEDREQISRLAMPEPATDRAEHIYELWHGGWLAALIVGVLVWGLILYAVFAFRRRSHDEIPVQTRYNLPIEILYTVAPIVIVVVFFFFTVQTQNAVLAQAATQNGGQAEHTIKVVGQKWSWTFNYMREDAVNGQNVYLAGTPAEIPTLVLPVDESVDIQLSSPDVIHSFWVPAFLFKLDVVPGRDNSFSFTPTREGTYAGKCAELCGTYHSRMLFNVEVVSRSEFDQHLRDLQAQGNTGTALGGSDAETQAGLEDSVQDDETSPLGDAQ